MHIYRDEAAARCVRDPRAPAALIETLLPSFQTAATPGHKKKARSPPAFTPPKNAVRRLYRVTPSIVMTPPRARARMGPFPDLIDRFQTPSEQPLRPPTTTARGPQAAALGERWASARSS